MENGSIVGGRALPSHGTRRFQSRLIIYRLDRLSSCGEPVTSALDSLRIRLRPVGLDGVIVAERIWLRSRLRGYDGDYGTEDSASHGGWSMWSEVCRERGPRRHE